MCFLFLKCELLQNSPENNPAQNTGNITIEGLLTDASDCKQFKTGDFFSELTDSVSCIEYSFNPDSNNLLLKHLNAGFNCCPKELSCSISAIGDTIYIQESELNGLCNCQCLFDLDIELEGLLPANYCFIFQESYLDKNKKLEFEIDLRYHPIGSYCVSWEEYPWEI